MTEKEYLEFKQQFPNFELTNYQNKTKQELYVDCIKQDPNVIKYKIESTKVSVLLRTKDKGFNIIGAFTEF